MNGAHNTAQSNKRTAERVPVELPLQVGTRTGATRDMSVCGIYFETDEVFAPGSEVDFSVDLQHAASFGTVRLVCKGKVVRVERKRTRLGVAVAIDTYRFEKDGQ